MTYLFLLIVFITSCKSNIDYQEYGTFQFAIYQDQPIFEEEYLYNKQLKNYLLITQDNFQWYLVDWNNNGKYDEMNIDYIGIKLPADNRPILTILKEKNYIKIDDQHFAIANRSNFRLAKKVEPTDQVNLATITYFTPIELTNGKRFDLAPKKDTSIIYFWATWCKPCIRTLENIDPDKLDNSSVELIPIAYNCSNIEKFLTDNQLDFPPMEISEQSANLYHLNSLPKTIVFDQNLNLLNAKIDLSTYYKN